MFINCEGESGKPCRRFFANNKDKSKYEKTVCSVNGGRNCKHYAEISILYERGKLPK